MFGLLFLLKILLLLKRVICGFIAYFGVVGLLIATAGFTIAFLLNKDLMITTGVIIFSLWFKAFLLKKWLT